NVDWAHPFPPIVLGSVIPLPSKETNRYRAISTLKIVNRYGILDSVLHIEKGSKVTTRDLLYDAETGNILLTQTNNEFDDPIYNFNYPAHWAYSGMGPAYKNIGTIFNNVVFRDGIMRTSDGQPFPVERFFESGDELLVRGFDELDPLPGADICSPNYYRFTGKVSNKIIWAI